MKETRPEDDPKKHRKEHDAFGTPYDKKLAGLHRHAKSLLKCAPIRVNEAQAKALLTQFQETTAHRQWEMLAVAIMVDHIHVVAGLPDTLPALRGLGDYKSYGSRALNQAWPKPASGTWWTSDGSARLKVNQRALIAAVWYVLYDQPKPLVVWSNEELLKRLGIPLKEGAGGVSPPSEATSD